MRITKIIFAFAMVTFLTGCVPSLHPLFTKEDLIFEPTLVGTWIDENGKDKWALQKSEENVYELIYTENDAPAKFKAHLLKLGEFLFIDIFPEEPDMKNTLYKGHLLPVHSFSRIWIKGDTLLLAMLDDNWLKDMVKEGKVKIGHDWLDQDIILTASTKDLQKFALKYSDDDKAFSNKAELYRQK